MENINKLNEILQKINTDIKNLQILDRDFTTYIPRYGKEIGLPYLKFDNNGICSLQFDAKINVLIVYNKEKNQCLFTSPIGPIPSETREEFLKKILISNAFGIENGGAILGIDEDSYQLVLSFIFVASTFSFELFKTVISNFVTMVENWQIKYENLIELSEKIKFKNLKIRKNKFQFNYDFSKFIDEEFKENEDFSEYIPKYGKEIGLPNLALNEKGVCSLNFDGQVNVDIVYSKENKQCFLASPIGNIPANADEKYFEYLLISNWN